MTVKKRSGTQVVLTLSSKIVKRLNQEIRRLREEDPESKPTRKKICASLIEEGILKITSTEEDRVESFNTLIAQSKELREKANKYKDSRSQSLCLLAAAKELEALSIINTHDEHIIKSSLIQIVQLVKRGTGYAYLPDVPVKKRHMSQIS